MYKLMLVDDEDIVRHQVIKKIDWASYGFEIVCEAENGSEAFELFELHQPDVVISDIKMPFMDGLELSEKILEKYPFTKIIILTGFDDFEYAKKGIDLHITNYVLKPVSSKELIRILQEVKDMIDEEIHHKQDVDRLKRHYEQSYDLMRSRFLESLVTGAHNSGDTADEWMNYYEVDLPGDNYMVTLIQIDRAVELHRDEMKNLEFNRIALMDLIKDLDEQFALGEYYMESSGLVLLSSCMEDHQASYVHKHMEKMEKVRQAVERFLPFTVTIGCGRLVDRLDNLSISRRGAGSACDYKLSLGSNQVIYINDLEKSDNGFEFGENQRRSLGRMLKAGLEEEVAVYIEEAFANLLHVDEERQLLGILEIFNTMAAAAKELDIPSEDLAIDDTVLLSILGKDESFVLKKERLISLGQRIMKSAANTRKTTNSSLVVEAVKYVEANYKDWELNIEKISAYLHYSPNYFSSTFKKESGNSFMNYLLGVRIDKAKELLTTTEMKNFEIAMEVGFSSANYFSYCFKKEVTQSPTAYRKSMA